MKSRCPTPDTRANIQREVEKRVREETQKQTKEIARKLCDTIDAVCLWTLHETFGFGKDRLRRFFDDFNKGYQEMLDFYEMGDDTTFVYLKKLHDIGVDIEEWENETK